MSIDVIESEPTFFPSKPGQGLGLRQLSDASGDRLATLAQSIRAKREAATKVRSGDLGSIIPGFVSTGDALTALENTKRYIDSLDTQIGRSFCLKEIGSGALDIGPLFSDCKQDKINFLVSWWTLVDSFYTFYLEHRSFLSRFADTNSIFNRAKQFAEGANERRDRAIAIGANIDQPKLVIDAGKNPLDDLFAWVKVIGILAAVVVLAPPVINMVRSIGGRRAVSGLEGTKKVKKLLPKSHFDKRSFRWKKSGKAMVLIGCPKGKWQPRKKRCKVGTRAYEVVTR